MSWPFPQNTDKEGAHLDKEVIGKTGTKTQLKNASVEPVMSETKITFRWILMTGLTQGFNLRGTSHEYNHGLELSATKNTPLNHDWNSVWSLFLMSLYLVQHWLINLSSPQLITSALKAFAITLSGSLIQVPQAVARMTYLHSAPCQRKSPSTKSELLRVQRKCWVLARSIWMLLMLALTLCYELNSEMSYTSLKCLSTLSQPDQYGIMTTSQLEGSEATFFWPLDGIVHVRSRTSATHAVLLRHHRLHVEDQRVPTAVVFHQQTSQSDEGVARS